VVEGAINGLRTSGAIGSGLTVETVSADCGTNAPKLKSWRMRRSGINRNILLVGITVATYLMRLVVSIHACSLNGTAIKSANRCESALID